MHTHSHTHTHTDTHTYTHTHTHTHTYTHTYTHTHMHVYTPGGSDVRIQPPVFGPTALRSRPLCLQQSCLIYLCDEPNRMRTMIDLYILQRVMSPYQWVILVIRGSYVTHMNEWEQIVARKEWEFRVAKTHRMPYLYGSFSAKEPYN